MNDNMISTNEIWKPVPGYESLYEVSNFGRVRNTHYWSSHHKLIERRAYRILKQETTHDGYKRVVLTKCGESRHFSVHRLVGVAFIPNPDSLPQINHIDENPANNVVDNLEWCDEKQNCNHGQHRERISFRQTNNPYHSKTVNQFDMAGNFIRTFPSTREAERQTGIASEQISRVCLGKNQHAGGYHWEYTDLNPDPDG